MYHTSVPNQGDINETETHNVPQARRFVAGLYISEICWTVVIWIVKYSILALYWRISSENRRSIRPIIWVLAAIVTAWGVAVVGIRPSHQWAVFVGRDSWLSDNRLVTYHRTPMYACLRILEAFFIWWMSRLPPCALYRHVDTTYTYRCHAFGLSGATDLEP